MCVTGQIDHSNLRSVKRPPVIKDPTVAVSLAGKIHVSAHPCVGCLLAQTLPVAVLGIFDVGASRHMLSIHIRPAYIAGMRHIAAGHNAVQSLELPFIHHASVRTSRSPFQQRRDQFSPLLPGDFDMPV